MVDGAEPMEAVLLLSCEHGGNRVPAPYRPLFAGSGRLLDSHRGLDIGARAAARYLQRHFGAPLVCATVTRLLVDLNRSEGNRTLFSGFTRGLPASERQEILDRYYWPYRELVAGWIALQLSAGRPVVHLSVHSFTPVLRGQRRCADIGLLYDPSRRREARFCTDWQRNLAAAARNWKVRRNYPYRGTADGLIPALRRRFDGASYFGVEIELNQGRLRDTAARIALLRDVAVTMPL